MYPLRLLIAAVFISAFTSCAPQLCIKSATWQTWMGGQPGVGGVRYQFVLENARQKPFILNQLTIDGKEYSEPSVTNAGDSILILASETISPARPTIDNPKPIQQYIRSTAPSNAQIQGIYRRKNITLETKTFEKAKSESYQ